MRKRICVDSRWITPVREQESGFIPKLAGCLLRVDCDQLRATGYGRFLPVAKDCNRPILLKK